MTIRAHAVGCTQALSEPVDLCACGGRDFPPEPSDLRRALGTARYLAEQQQYTLVVEQLQRASAIAAALAVDLRSSHSVTLNRKDRDR